MADQTKQAEAASAAPAEDEGKAALRRMSLFSELKEDDLERLYQMAVPLTIKPGENLIVEGDPGDSMYVIVDGEFDVNKRSGKQDVFLGVRKTGEIVGEMAVLDNAPRNATVRATRDSHVLQISQAAFQHVLACSPSAVVAVLHTFATRQRNIEALLSQNEKMASLGSLAAGLAHELNNPAAAVRRSTDQLRSTLDEWQRLGVELDTMSFDETQTETLRMLRLKMSAQAAAPVALDPLARSDLEDELQTWLQDQGLEDPWEIAPILASYGWSPDTLGELAGGFDARQLEVLIPWLAQGTALYSLLDELGMSAERISEIVKAVKNYTYLDQAPVQEVDVHQGLEDTLVILRHKLKAGINVVRQYAPDLPRIEAFAGELNQVWTNLIDNAIQAMDGHGELTLRTHAVNNGVVVEITDNGAGITPEVRAKLFEPFFTTKPQGVGTGLGLYIVYNIVITKHHGQIGVTSEPGMTTFKVTLPLRLEKE